MAAYYRSLLFAKTGITRESLLGYRVDRFSPKALAAFNEARLEHALELLLNLYRDIRYSVSARFELEAVVAKLCLLTRWVSPEELAVTLDAARAALGAGGGAVGAPPPAVGEGVPARAGTAARLEGGADAGVSAPPEVDLSSPGALREEFKRYIHHDARPRPVDVVARVFDGIIVENGGKGV
jgi:DNA polymerase-3 subunit gamma/tau